MSLAWAYHFFVSQFTQLPAPSQSFAGETIIVTGANTGLGFDAAQHFVRLGAARVILACRSQTKADNAKAAIEQATGRKGVAEVWMLDMSSYDSVRAFAARVGALDRVDRVLLNAGVQTLARQPIGDTEMTLMVNVYATFLLVGLLLPRLKTLAAEQSRAPVVTVVTSEVHHMPNPFEAGAKEDVFAWMDSEESYKGMPRYVRGSLDHL